MMNSQLSETVVGKIVAQNPAVARVFEEHQIDYCCRGATTLAEACQLQQVDVDKIVQEIEAAQRDTNPSDGTNWNEEPLTRLADHIVDTHHEFLGTELPRLTGLIDKVNKAHGEKRPELANVQQTFSMLRDELESHMAKEEQILFPAIKIMESAGGPTSFPFGSVNNPIQMMEHEHDVAGNALRKLRELTNGYVPPSGACPTYCVMLESLENFERDMHFHIHKENNILFPRAAELERSTAAR